MAICDECNEEFYPIDMVFCGQYYLCHGCSRKHPSEEDAPEEIPAPSLLNLIMRREINGCVRRLTTEFYHALSQVDGMQLRYNMLQRPKMPEYKLLNRNEILIYMLPEKEDEDSTEIAQRVLDTMGIDKSTVVSAIRICIKSVSKSKNEENKGAKPLLIKMQADWRNRPRRECHLGPNDIILRGIPDLSRPRPRFMLSGVDPINKADPFLIQLVSRNIGVYIEEDMFTAQRLPLNKTSCDYDCGAELPRALLVRFTSCDVKETLVRLLRNRTDLFERAPNDFTPVKRERQGRYPGAWHSFKLCRCEEFKNLLWNTMHTGGIIKHRFVQDEESIVIVVRISCDGSASAMKQLSDANEELQGRPTSS